jgi:hypothetical protein
MVEYFQSKSPEIQTIYLTTKDPSYFIEASKIFSARIYENLEANKFYVE